MRWLLRDGLLAAWCTLCAALLCTGLEGLRHPSDPANIYNTIIFFQSARLIAFPTGFFVWHGLYGLFAWLTALGSEVSPTEQMWFVSIGVAVAGYVQWFHAAPWLIRRVVRDRSRRL